MGGDVEGDVDPGRQRHLASSPCPTGEDGREDGPGGNLPPNTAVSNDDRNEQSLNKNAIRRE